MIFQEFVPNTKQVATMNYVRDGKDLDHASTIQKK